MICLDCKDARESGNRLPKGWKRKGESVYCAECWRKKYILRAITLPVSFAIDRTPKDMWEALGKCWSQTREVANWALTELAKADAVKTPEMKRLPKFPKLYLYPGARARRPDMTPQSVCSLLQAVESKYRKSRFDTIFRGEASLPIYRYPVPYPVHNQSWSLERDSGGRYVVNVPLSGERWQLALNTFDRERQKSALNKIISGEAIKGELALYRIRSNPDDRRGEGTESSSGGSPKAHYRVMAKMVAWLPRPKEPKGDEVMLLRTDPNAFWVAEIESRQPWIVNADHIRRWQESHRVFRQRVSEDLKYEKRWPKRKRKNINAYIERRCRNHNNRIDSFCHEMTACLREYAVRQRVGEVIYDDTCRIYLPSFPYYKISEMLAYKLDEAGITLTGRAPNQ